MAQTAARIDPLRSFNFRVEIDNMTLASFSEVSGLTVDGDVVEYREGTDSANHVRKYPGLGKTSNITFKIGVSKQIQALWDWYTARITGAPDLRRNGTIVLQDDTHADAVYFHFTNGFLNKIIASDYKAAGNEVAIESAELVVESLTMKLAK